ncbi:MAG: helix-turn-helix domain-containing protein [Anaerolineae bacterium]|nr:helix-turn-helix domain-containing protein [Anaerolineae bacterium]
MSLVLGVIGFVWYLTGRARIGGFQAEGRRVKAAGVLLMLPVMLTLTLLNAYLPSAVQINAAETVRTLFIITMLELSAVCAALGCARIVLLDPPGSPRLPGLLGQLQREARLERLAYPQMGILPNPLVVRRPRLKRQPPRDVMTLAEAACYLGVREAEVLRLIDEGKLPAARDHDAYKIARSQLDALR